MLHVLSCVHFFLKDPLLHAGLKIENVACLFHSLGKCVGATVHPDKLR